MKKTYYTSKNKVILVKGLADLQQAKACNFFHLPSRLNYKSVTFGGLTSEARKKLYMSLQHVTDYAV